MSGDGNFWDNVDTSEEGTPNVETKDELSYIPREAQELSNRIASLFTCFMIAIPLLLLTAPFALVSMGLLGGEGCWGSLEYLEDGKLHCVEGDTFYNPEYSFSEHHVSVEYNDGWSELLRWEIIGDGGVIGFAYFDSYSGDDTWFSYGHCEWEGGEFEMADNQWYCGMNEGSVSNYGFEHWHSYCEFQEMNWYCTDSFGKNASFADTSNETRAGPEILDKWTYDCLPVVAKSPFENTSIQTIHEIEANVVLPQWCYESPTFTANNNTFSTLPFNGEAVYLYPMGFEHGYIDMIQYSENMVYRQVFSLHTFNEDGTLSEESEQASGGFPSILGIIFILFYLIGGYGLYVLSTGKNHIEHLGSENTIVVSSSWRNKPRKVKATIPLSETSRLHFFTTTSTRTDSEGHTSTHTSHHHEITHLDRKADSLPNGFSTDELLQLTGLQLI